MTENFQELYGRAIEALNKTEKTQKEYEGAGKLQKKKHREVKDELTKNKRLFDKVLGFKNKFESEDATGNKV